MVRGARAPQVCTAFAKGEGFTLRMPAADLPEWQTTDESGRVTNLPRPARGVRVWDAGARAYVAVDTQLSGAPSSAKDADEWYRKLIRALKGSPYLGSQKVDDLVTSTQNKLNTETGEVEALDPGTVDNKWTKLALAAKCA